MYNFLVSSNKDAWDGEPWEIELSRCIREYTDGNITERFGELDKPSIDELKRLPCIFAYERVNHASPKFGALVDVVSRQGIVRVNYQIQAVPNFLSASDLESLSFELDIRKWELNRTHWAVKDVNLQKELRSRGISFPSWVQDFAAVDITRHSFDVAFSFPSEVRDLVKAVSTALEPSIGPNSYFYDENYVSQLARPSLDTLLQDIYRNRAKLIVVFLGSDYQRKNWCGVEFRAIKDIIMQRDHNRIMLIRTDDGEVEGIFSTDGYIDARRFQPREIAQFIVERLRLLP